MKRILNWFDENDIMKKSMLTLLILLVGFSLLLDLVQGDFSIGNFDLSGFVRQVVTGPDEITIIDISYWQSPERINYDVLLEQVDGVILRAAYGTRLDTAFDRHYYEISRRGIPIGAYHFLVEYKTVEEQVAVMREAISGKVFQLGLWADVEIEPNAALLTKETVTAYMRQAEKIFGEMGIYTGAWSWNTIMGNDYYNNRKLWVATYGSDPLLPHGWEDYWIWQFTDKGKFDGYYGSLDTNVFNGSEEEWESWINDYSISYPDPFGPSERPTVVQFQARCKATALNVRSGPSVSSNIVGVLYFGDVVDVYEVSCGWFRIGDDRWVSGNYMEKIIWVPTPTPTPTPKFRYWFPVFYSGPINRLYYLPLMIVPR